MRACVRFLRRFSLPVSVEARSEEIWFATLRRIAQVLEATKVSNATDEASWMSHHPYARGQLAMSSLCHVSVLVKW